MTAVSCRIFRALPGLLTGSAEPVRRRTTVPLAGPDRDGQQHLQRGALRRRVARQIGRRNKRDLDHGYRRLSALRACLTLSVIQGMTAHMGMFEVKGQVYGFM